MTLLDNLKARIETTDLSDAELQPALDAATDEIIQRFGPVGEEIEVAARGETRRIDLARPADEEKDITIVETVGTTDTTLEADDFRVWNGGRTIERLRTGTNSRFWFGTTLVITYTPVDDSKQRDEAAIKLAILNLQYSGLASESLGDEKMTTADHDKERAKILATLQPRGGLFFR